MKTLIIERYAKNKAWKLNKVLSSADLLQICTQANDFKCKDKSSVLKRFITKLVKDKAGLPE